ncbi:hypothetical protein HGM15179_015291 [Zosterops borbonicus]|uniref:Uncharacterized protein n=1 Tax=Zosterops borbonicus TaxID=364589 RepID=A0A8K1LFA2_9PASS|nr:hypothetical protein HGM15179_015291 [Zosterops borbonicus]
MGFNPSKESLGYTRTAVKDRFGTGCGRKVWNCHQRSGVTSFLLQIHLSMTTSITPFLTAQEETTIPVELRRSEQNSLLTPSTPERDAPNRNLVKDDLCVSIQLFSGTSKHDMTFSCGAERCWSPVSMAIMIRGVVDLWVNLVGGKNEDMWEPYG